MPTRLNQNSECLSTSPTLLVFADDWGRHPSSAQHLVKRLRGEFRVLWVNSIGTRRVRVNGFTLRRGVEKLRSWRRGLTQVAEQMWVVDVPMLPTAGGRIGRQLNRRWVNRYLRYQMAALGIDRPVVLTTLPHTLDLFRDLPRSGLIYYCTDDYSRWPSADRDHFLSAEQELVEAADQVLGVSSELVERLGPHKPCTYFPHAVDFEHFVSAADAEIHVGLRDVPAPRIGFFGLIYEKLDFELLTRIACELPQTSLVMIGPVAYCPEEFTRLPNVHLLGPQPYAELPSWLAGFDVLLMPYVNDEMIRQSNPLKLRECLATGKPTVCIDIQEVHRFRPHVMIGSTADEYLSHVRAALNRSESPELRKSRQAAVQDDGTWDSRARELSEIVRGVLRNGREGQHVGVA